MPGEPDVNIAPVRIRLGELAGWLAMAVGAAFVPGLIIALCVIVIVAISHLVG